jgi:hypothetical protein
MSWEPIASEPLPCDVAELRRIMEGPDFYKSLRARHKKMRAPEAQASSSQGSAERRKRWA